MTTFKPLRTTDFEEQQENGTKLNPCITEPILASFPSNLPTGKAL